MELNSWTILEIRYSTRFCKVCGWRHIFLDEGLMQLPEDLTEPGLALYIQKLWDWINIAAISPAPVANIWIASPRRMIPKTRTTISSPCLPSTRIIASEARLQAIIIMQIMAGTP